LTAENCTAILIGAAALIEAHVTFRPPLFRVGWDTVQRTQVQTLNSHFPQLHWLGSKKNAFVSR
jgi:hypothetical protein